MFAYWGLFEKDSSSRVGMEELPCSYNIASESTIITI